MIPRRNPLANISLEPYQEPQAPQASYPQMQPMEFAPMNIQHAQFSPDNNETGNAIGGLGAALLNRKKPNKIFDSPIMMNKGNEA